MNRADRLVNANAVLRAMGSHGRRFFYSSQHDRYAELILDDAGRLRIVDEQSGKAVAIIAGGKWRGFKNGGTCRAIVEDLARYVRTGKPTRNHFGPWTEWVCDGDLWGYGANASQSVRDEIRNNPAVTVAA